MISLSRRGSAISSASEIVAEGMLIAPWVAMRRPLEFSSMTGGRYGGAHVRQALGNAGRRARAVNRVNGLRTTRIAATIAFPRRRPSGGWLDGISRACELAVCQDDEHSVQNFDQNGYRDRETKIAAAGGPRCSICCAAEFGCRVARHCGLQPLAELRCRLGSNKRK